MDVNRIDPQAESNEGSSSDPSGPTLPQTISRPQIAKLRYSHDAMIDVLISNPAISQNELASLFGYTASWICIILSSDAFKHRLAERRSEVIDPALSITVEEKFKAIAEVSAQKLVNYLSSGIAVHPDVLIKAAALGAKVAGVGMEGKPKMVVSSAEHLQELSHRLTGLLRDKRDPEPSEIIDVESTEVPKDPS